MRKWKILFAIAVIFIAGLIIGSVATGIYVKYKMEALLQEGPRAMKTLIMNKLTSELHLTPSQQKEIETVVSKTQSKLQALRLKFQPEAEQEIDSAVHTIKTMLTSEQSTKFDRLYHTLKNRWRVPERKDR